MTVFSQIPAVPYLLPYLLHQTHLWCKTCITNITFEGFYPLWAVLSVHIIQVCLSCESSSANNAFERLLSFMNWCHMTTHLAFLCKTCIANITIERLFLHELILVQEADKKFEPFNDHNAIGVKFWSFMFLCYMLVQSWKPSVLNKTEAFSKD